MRRELFWDLLIDNFKQKWPQLTISSTETKIINNQKLWADSQVSDTLRRLDLCHRFGNWTAVGGGELEL